MPPVSPTASGTTLSSHWLTEQLTAHESHRHHIKKILVRAQTPFQKAVLLDSYSFGRCLVLDGEMQSAQLDEFIYHECLVQPALVTHPHPRNILVLGGGEGATVREILRHPDVQSVTMVDIDRQVVDFCKTYLKEWHQGALAHRKVRLVIQDAHSYIRDTNETFDIIISDLPTPEGKGPLYRLHTLEFYRTLVKRLRPGGLFIAQAGSGHLLQMHFHSALAHTLRQVFKIVRPYYAFVPSFDVPWAFLMSSQKWDPLLIRSVEVDRRLNKIGKILRFYDGEAHEGLFRIPKYLRDYLKQEKELLTQR